ncbi:MAG: DUF6155 family protein [Waterburya sp.]
MTQPKINLTTLKKHLKTRSQAELIADIAELYKRFQPVKDYYQIQLYPQDEKQVAAKYKKIIEDEFFPARGFGRARLSVAKKAITEYKKVNLLKKAWVGSPQKLRLMTEKLSQRGRPG